MGFDTICTCGHTDMDHAQDAPEGEQECFREGCHCKDFDELPDDLIDERFPNGLPD